MTYRLRFLVITVPYGQNFRSACEIPHLVLFALSKVDRVHALASMYTCVHIQGRSRGLVERRNGIRVRLDGRRQTLCLSCRQLRLDFEFTNESSVGCLRKAVRHATKRTTHALGTRRGRVFTVARTFAVLPDDEPREITLQLFRVGVKYINTVFEEALRCRVLVLVFLPVRLVVKASLDPPLQSFASLFLDGFLEPGCNSEGGRCRTLGRVYDNV